MLLTLALFFILLLLIYSLSRRLTGELYRLLGLELLSFFLLPGTVVHELSHMLLAEVLFVKTNRFNFKPRITEGNGVTVGNLEVSQTDPFRRTLIGLAPLVSGIGLIYLIYQSAINNQQSTINNLTIYQLLILFAICYLIFAISVTMFSSPKDLEVAIIPAFLFLIVLVFFYLAGFKLTVPKNTLDFLARFFANLNRPLGLAAILDLAGLLVLKGLNSLIKPH